jgi:membrane-associated PAP2 superfamily phosphatase
LLITCAFFFTHILEVSGIDFVIQDFFYNTSTEKWLVDEHNPLLKMLFYTGPKVLAGGAGICMLVWIITKGKCCPSEFGSPRRPQASRDDEGEKSNDTHEISPLMIVLASLILVPLFLSLLKEITYIYCPVQVKMYGGPKDFRALFDFSHELFWKGRGKCFPAGHATVGFAFMSLYFVFKQKYARILGLCAGLTLGWITGLYQMMKGAHFLSHSLATMMLSWAIILCVECVYRFFSKRCSTT